MMHTLNRMASIISTPLYYVESEAAAAAASADARRSSGDSSAEAVPRRMRMEPIYNSQLRVNLDRTNKNLVDAAAVGRMRTSTTLRPDYFANYEADGYDLDDLEDIQTGLEETSRSQESAANFEDDLLTNHDNRGNGLPPGFDIPADSRLGKYLRAMARSRASAASQGSPTAAMLPDAAPTKASGASEQTIQDFFYGGGGGSRSRDSRNGRRKKKKSSSKPNA